MRNSEIIYHQLVRENAKQTKFLNGLKKVKKACDEIEITKGKMNYSRVGEVAKSKYGGPSGRAIIANPKHKSYIDARIIEYAGPDQKALQQKSTAKAKFPDIDHKTQQYITQLEKKLDLQERVIETLQKDVLKQTKETPLDFHEMVEQGANKDGAMTIITAQPTLALKAAITEEVRQTIYKILFKLPELVEGVEGYQGKALRLSCGDFLLDPMEFASLYELLCVIDDPVTSGLEEFS